MKLAAILVMTTAFALANAALAQGGDELVIVTQTPNGPIIDPGDNPHLKTPELSKEITEIISALDQVESFGVEIEKLVELVGQASHLQELEPDISSRIEDEILSWTKPLPASNLEGNLAGYKALANLRPDEVTYSSPHSPSNPLISLS